MRTFAIFSALVLVSSSTLAAISVSSVDPTRVSAVAGLNTPTVTIYGGTAGTSCGTDVTHTCSSCLPTSALGDSALTTCNDQRINPNLLMHITVSSNTMAEGYTAIASGDSTSTAGVVLPSLPQRVSTGQSGLIEVSWAQICAHLTIFGTGSTLTNCAFPAGSNLAIGTFQVGLAQSAGEAFGAGSDFASIKIIVQAGDVIAPSLATIGGDGITSYEILSGENKGILDHLRVTDGTGFPNSEGGPFKAIRVLFEKRTDKKTSVWSKINPGSPHIDLSIKEDKRVGLMVSPSSFTKGMGRDLAGRHYLENILNGSVYDTKLAVVDAAGNAGLYTGQADDTLCDTTTPGLSGRPECHTIRPARVRGHR